MKLHKFGHRLEIMAGIILVLGVTMTAYSQQPATASATPAASPAKAQESPNPVVLSVKGLKITESEFMEMLSNLPMQQQRQYAQPGGRRMFADYLGRMLALSEAGEKEGLEKNPNIAVQLRLARMQVLAFAEQEAIRNRVLVSNEEIQKYYDQNKSQFIELHLLHISVPLSNDPAKAAEDEQIRSELQKVRDRAARGEDFQQLARTYSKDSDATAGGNLGFVGRGKFGDAIDNVVFRLKPGQVSDVFDGPGAVHIFKAVEERPQPLASARGAITDILKSQMLQMSMMSLIREMQPTVNELFFAKDNETPEMTLPATVQVERNGKPVGRPVPVTITPSSPGEKKK